ncbi:MFS transporter [Lysobacter niabensis]|uniref:MFS transporter n=1 Tax=Agrilutibacter niabensis TaxID=380628 RepID=UPI00361C86DA
MPATLPREARLLLLGRGLRAFVDGYVAVLLPAYLLALGLGTWHVGLLSTATLLGSALMTLAVGAWGHRLHHRRLLLAAALLMALTGFAFASVSGFWPLLLVAFVGTLNPSSGDVSVFLPLEHARLAHAAQGEARTTLFARYSLTGALLAALGALAAAVPEALGRLGIGLLPALRVMFVLYGVAGISIWLLYRRLPGADEALPAPPAPLRESRGIVTRLAALFSLDAFAGGLLVQSLLALWLFKRFDLSLGAAAAFFFWSGLMTALSQLAAPLIARRIGLLNTMVFTHIPSSLALIAAAFAPRLEIALGLLLLRSALSQMDVPTRSAYVMSVVTPAERTAAASYTAVPRSLASALSPALGGVLLATGWLATPLVACGVLKIAYDLTLLRVFRGVRVESE